MQWILAGGVFEQEIACYKEIYRAGQGIEILTLPIVVSGEEILPGFSLDIV